jgi:S-methylmethionine-dependent homocysteine/selenocysteine methylase
VTWSWPDTAIVADGGLATELEEQGHNLSDELWSARLVADAPDAIRAAHLAYFQAGAMIATTARIVGGCCRVTPSDITKISLAVGAVSAGGAQRGG